MLLQPIKINDMSHLLNDKFINDLKNGQLTPLLDYIKHDNTLDLQIREQYINIYYLGGNILKVSEKKNLYDFYFDYKYISSSSVKKDVIDGYKKSQDWNSYFPVAKQAMDFYFTKHKKEEREFQQLIVRENNYTSIANSTDYFVIDIEYDTQSNARFDIIAVEWPSESSIRKLSKGYRPKLCVMELKYGDDALGGGSGMLKHWNDFKKFSTSPSVSEFKSEMIDLFNQKRALG